MSQSSGSQTQGFLFADLRDYTRFVEAHGDQAAADLLARFRLLTREVIGRFDGAEIRTEGDSFYVVFPSASAAVNGGLALLEAAAASTGRGIGGSAAIPVGVGVHAGETAATAEGPVGSAVIVAARICAVAHPGELLVSDTVHGLTRTFLPVHFIPRGRRRLKGITDPVPLFQVVRAGGTAGTTITSRRGRAGKPVVAASVIGIPVLIAAAVLAGILGGIGPFAGIPSQPVDETPTEAATPTFASPSADAGPEAPLSESEAALAARLPAAINSDCGPVSVAEGSAGGVASLRCDLQLSASADEVWVDEFRTAETLEGAFATEVARVRAPPGECETDSIAHGTWAVPNVHSGSLLCYEEQGEAWLAWTYLDERILMKARRADGDAAALYAWWRETAIFLR